MFRNYKVKVKNLMTNIDIKFLTTEHKLRDAISFALLYNMENIPIVDKDNKLLGLMPIKKIINMLNNGINLSTKIKEVKIDTYKDICIREDSDLDISIEDINIKELFIIDKDCKIVGTLNKLEYMERKLNFLIESFKSIINSSQVLNTILETVYDGIIVVDKDGYITMISKAYAKFLGVRKEEVIGKHVTDVIENTRMHIVAKTGVPEIADIQKINGNYMIASRIPIIKDSEIVGVVGKVLFRNIDELNNLHKKINLMERELEQYKGELKQINKAKYTFECIIGKSKKIIETKRLAKKAALTESNVLLIGESGTGKELFAHAIHNASNRKYGPFVKVNCAAIPADLLESELFGYEEGAFTGAKKGGKIGKFELADGGTIFLDEIGDMPLHMQAKLLRVIQEREVEKIGGIGSKRVDVRIVAATNKNLKEMVKEGKYREDLFYRLNVLTINIPALRERPEDISLLCNYFLSTLCQKYHKKIDTISDDALNYLIKYNWPGNVRELANTIEWAVNMIDRENSIELRHIMKKIIDVNYKGNLKSLKEILEEAEREALIESLKITGGNKSKAAKILGIGRTTFYEKLQKYNIISI